MDSIPSSQSVVAAREPASPPDQPPSVFSDDQETDVWWGAFAGRTMLPSFILCALVTGVVVVMAWLGWLEYRMPELLARYLAYALIGPIWLYQLSRWGYRILTQTYRLTNRRLFIERTFFHTPPRVVPVERMTGVTVERTYLEARLHVGRLRLSTDFPELPVLILEGVHDPERIAGKFRALMARVRAGG